MNIDIAENTDLNNQVEQQSFPIEVFPQQIQDVINATSAGLQFPTDFSAGSILYAASVAIGNTYKVKVKEGWSESALIYITLVGPPGSNKTHPLAFFTDPISDMDSKTFNEYKRCKSEYESNLQLSKTERDEMGIGQPKKPHWLKLLISDTTPEALAETHSYNLRGLGSYTDELATWFKNFERYHKGSDEQFWLSNWSNKPIRIDRKTGEPIFIENPFISVGGTIQPGVIKDLAKNRTSNGFLDRILFVAPYNLQKEYWGNDHLDPSIKSTWSRILESILNTNVFINDNGQLISEVVSFSATAYQILSDWQRYNTDQCNTQPESIAGVYTKLEIYVIRISLILHLLKRACGESAGEIEDSSIQGAIQIVEYFRATATRIHSLLSASPLDKLPEDKKGLFKALPIQFTTEEALSIAESLDVPERTCKRFIADDKFFKHVKRGQYEKAF